MNKKFKIVAFGCKVNQYDGQAFRTQLEKKGWKTAHKGEEVDLFIINSCVVTQEAEKETLKEIASIVKQNPKAEIWLSGCISDESFSSLLSLPQIRKISPESKDSFVETRWPSTTLSSFAIDHFEGHTRAFVKIQEGCNRFCSYCIVPYTRGPSRSRSMEQIREEVCRLVEKGHKEVVLTGTHIGDFSGGLTNLVTLLESISGLHRIRLSSLSPDELDPNLLEQIAQGKKICPQVHLVLQSGSNEILKRMGRRYTRELFLEKVASLRALNTDCTITTDIIVGFPGETEKDFLESLSVIREASIAKVHLFPFSPRKGTPAFHYPHSVPHAIVQERKKILLSYAKQVSFAIRETFVGRQMEVLVEGKSNQKYLFGHTRNYFSVRVPKGRFLPNDLITVILENTPEEEFLGKIL